MNATVASRRWYQIPMVWMVIGIPLFSVVSTLTFVWISVQTFDGVVVDDYYRRGIEINRDLARDRYADEINLSASVSMSEERLQVRFRSDADVEWPKILQLGFYHPTVANRDVIVNLEHDGSGEYSTGVPGLQYGKWNVVTGNERWRLTGTLFYPDRDGFRLRAAQPINVIQ